MYGRKYMGTARVTFVISESGVIEDIIEKVDTKNHTDQILNKEVILQPCTPARKTSNSQLQKKGISQKRPPKKTASKKEIS